MYNNISSLRQKVTLGQAKGAPSGMLGHVAKEGAEALGCIWGTGYFKHITSKHRVPSPAVLSAHCNPTVLLHTMSWVTDPAASDTLGCRREAIAVCSHKLLFCFFFGLGLCVCVFFQCCVPKYIKALMSGSPAATMLVEDNSK